MKFYDLLQFGVCVFSILAAALWLPVAPFIAGAAESDAMQERAIVADHRSFADDDAGRVIEHHALADLRRGMNVDL